MKIIKFYRFDFHMLLGIIVILWINSGIFSYLSIYLPNILKISVFFIWFIIACLRKKTYLVKYLLNAKFLLLFFLVVIMFNFNNTNVYLAYYLKTTSFLFVIYSLFLYYYDYGNLREKKLIALVLIIDYIYVGGNTLIKLSQNPGLSRYLSMNEDMIIRILGTGSESFLAIGNYMYAYTMVFVGLFCFYELVYLKKMRFFIAYIFVFFVIIKMQFTIALFMLILFSMVLLAMKSRKNKYEKFLIVFSLIIVSCIGLIFLPVILQVLSPFMPIRVSSKFIQLSDFLKGVNIEGTDFSRRLELYTQSINIFAKNMIIGNYNGSSLIGGHSTWFDFMGQFGLFALPIFIFFNNIYKDIVKRLPKGSNNFIKCSYMYFFFLGFINTIYIPRLLLAILIFVPIIGELYSENSNSTRKNIDLGRNDKNV